MRWLEVAARERVQKRHLAGRAMLIIEIRPLLAGGSVGRAQLTQYRASNGVGGIKEIKLGIGS
jgi:hypothetical protein